MAAKVGILERIAKYLEAFSANDDNLQAKTSYSK
jgi:hypothetical protein